MNKKMLLTVLAVLMVPVAAYAFFGYNRDGQDTRPNRGLIGNVVTGTVDIADDATDVAGNAVRDTGDVLTGREPLFSTEDVEDEEDWSTNVDADNDTIEEEEVDIEETE